MTFATDGGIEWEEDTTNKKLTIRPATTPQEGYASGQMKDYTTPFRGNPSPWGIISQTNYTLVIESGILNIGNYAFYQCSGFTGVLSIPSTVTSIGENAFNECTDFTGELKIPSGVTTIKSYAFDGVYNISSINFYGNQPTTIGAMAFNLSFLSSKTYTVYSNGWANATTFPEYDYTKWSFINYSIAGGIEWYKDDTNKILTIRPTVNPQSGYASGQMKDYDTQDRGPWWFSKSTATGYALVLENGITNIGDYAFWSMSGLSGSITIPDTVKIICQYSFILCTGFNGTLKLSANLEKIEDDAFSQCTGLTGGIEIPDKVTTIGYSAFEDCSGFTGLITIGHRVASISNYAFFGCQNAEGVIMKCNRPSMGSNVFELRTARIGVEKTFTLKSNGWATSTTFPEYTYTKWNYQKLDKFASVNVNGVWKGGIMYVKKNGVWAIGTPCVKADGEWK